MLINRHNCIQCCLKHLASAAVIAREIRNGYDTPEYRFYLIGNLNEAQEQISGIDPAISRLIRIQRLKAAPDGLRTDVTPEMIRLLEKIACSVDARHKRGLYDSRGEQPVSACRCSQPNPVDILIPLRADGSKRGNLELRFALRSIERHLRGYRKIWIVSARPPSGFRGYGYIRCEDTRPRKQMNIHCAITAAFRTPEVADEVIFWADDNVLLAPLAVADLPVAARSDGLLGYSGADDARVWHRSLRQTGEALQSKGYPAVNFEAHTPVRFNRRNYLALESEFDFFSGAGLCYISLYLNRYGVKESVPMRQIKATAERGSFSPVSLAGRLFLGYNDAGFEAGAADWLPARFPEPSRYEAAASAGNLYPEKIGMGVVIGTCGSAFHVELQLAALARFNPLPALVVDDHSGDPALPAICRKYGAEFLSLPRRYGHRAGDLRIFCAGLEWANRSGISLLVKFSRRFLPLREWRNGLETLARISNAVTFSSWTITENLGFRTECMGMYVPAWLEAAPAIREAAPAGACFVERFLHGQAKLLAGRWNSEPFERYCKLYDPGREHEGFAFWTELMGTDRKAPPPDVLWHHAHGREAYRAAAEKLGIT